MSERTHLRRAGLADAGALVAIARSSPSAPQWTTAQYEDLLLPKDSAVFTRAVWLAEQDGAAAGFAVASVLCPVRPAEAELESIAVAPDVRRSGVGKALLASVAAWATEQGADRLRLEVREGNAEAIGFYAALGFVPTGIRRGYYSAPVENAVCMERVFEPLRL